MKLDKVLVARAADASDKAGYSSVEEFIEHAVEKELLRLEEAQLAVQQLKGLGYLE